MKRAYRPIEVIFLLMAGVILLAIAGCQNPTGPNDTVDTGDSRIRGPALRYETVPYSNTEHMGESGGSYKLVHSAYDADSNYYLYLLGHVNFVPVAYRQAGIYNGMTPITIGYSSSNTTEASIMLSTTTAFENSVSKSQELNYSVTATVGFKAEPWSASVAASVGGSTTWDDTETRSVSDTYETVRTETSEFVDSMEMTVGENNEPKGKYRYCLFGTTDVYFVLVTNKEKTVVEDSYTAICARPASYAWGLDYEPDMAGSFAKTAPGDLLEIPDLDIAVLPDPTSNDLTVIPAPEPPRADPKGGNYVGAISVKLSTNAASNATIYYTTNGDTPTRDSTQYTTPINISTGSTTLKAIAANASTISDVMTETYTITPGRVYAEKSVSFEVAHDQGATIEYTRGDGSMNTKSDSRNECELEVDIRKSGNNAKAAFIYTVKENGGDHTIRKLRQEITIPLNKIDLRIEEPSEGDVHDTVSGTNNSLVETAADLLNGTPITALRVQIDGSGGNDDKDNMRAVGTMLVKYSYQPTE